MLKSSLCDYSVAYELAYETISVAKTAATDSDVNNTKIKVIFKNCAPFADLIGSINR